MKLNQRFKNCDNCNKRLIVRKRSLETNSHWFCGLQCRSEWKIKNNDVRVVVKCAECGKEKIITKCRLKDRVNHFCNKSCHSIWKSKHGGPDHPLHGRTGEHCPWFGKYRGERSHKYIKNRSLIKSGINEAIRNSKEMDEWRLAVYGRDNFTCQICGCSKSGRLQAHHIKRFALFPERRFAVDNGITLCVNCHKSIRGEEESHEFMFFKLNAAKKEAF